MTKQDEDSEAEKRQEGKLERLAWAYGYKLGAFGKTKYVLEIAKKLHKEYHDNFINHKEP